MGSSNHKMVSQEEVYKKAKVGDIFVFSRGGVAASWSCLTRSKWDHCAILMKTPSGKKFLVEAVSPKVLIWRFDKAINWWFTKGNAKSIAWRQIKGVTVDQRVETAFFKFTNEMQNRPYENQFSELVGAILSQDSERCCCKEKANYKDVDGKSAHKYSKELSLDLEAIVKKEMKLLDKNQDGLVSEEEFKASGKTTEEFQQYDENGDGLLDEEEMMKRAQEQFSPGVDADQDLIVADMMADLEGERKQSTKALFCSEMVMLYLQQAGWMSKEEMPHHFLPKDFSDDDNANAEYYLQNGAKLGPMTLINPQPPKGWQEAENKRIQEAKKKCKDKEHVEKNKMAQV